MSIVETAQEETLSGGNPTCILVLQGGGAMGAYHIGALQALQEHAFAPNWVCGISIGAINGAIIAGNVPELRLERLDAFWSAISGPLTEPGWRDIRFKTWEHYLSFTRTLLFGQPGFFKPRPVEPYFAPPGLTATSFYDTAPLYETLAQVVDFDYLNECSTRLTVGATDVETGQLTFFDTHKKSGRFGPEHVVASGSLPPGFPATQIGGRSYWDGGCVSNSPLEAVADELPAGHTVIFVIDLWSASGPVPDTMEAVAWRAKQIQYATRAPNHLDALAAKLNLAHAWNKNSETAQHNHRVDLVHVVYHPTEDEIPSSDAEFSRTSIAARRLAGLTDMRRALDDKPWRRIEKTENEACMIHKVSFDGIQTIHTAK